MKNIAPITLVILALLSFNGRVLAADVPGSKDPDFLKRFEGSEIVSFFNRNFDEYAFYIEPITWDQWGNIQIKKTTLEGQITRIVYREPPPDHSALELFRNYQEALSGAGFKNIIEVKPSDCKKGAPGQIYAQLWENGTSPFQQYAIQECAYIGAMAERDGQKVYIMVTIADYNQPLAITFTGAKNPETFNHGILGVMVDVITLKPVKISLVTVKSDDMAKTLKDTGKVDIYGITFDVDKTDIKPDSTATLEQVAQLLKNDGALKLEVAGHTDNSGDKSHNQTLSEGRAKAVVHTLVTQYGIDASRLQAKGYGDTKPVVPNDSDDGKAKNRRVELRKL